MRNLFRGFLFAVASIVMIVGVAFCGFNSLEHDMDGACASEQEFSIIRIDLSEDEDLVVDDDYLITGLKFYYQSAFIEFEENGYEFDGADYDVRITLPAGEVAGVVEGCLRKEDAGEGKLYYYLTQEELVSKLEVDVEGFEFPYAIPADKNTEVKFDVIASDPDKGTFSSNYFYDISYSTVTSLGTKYTIFSPQLDMEGMVSVGGTFEASTGLYRSVINGRVFKSNFDNSNGGKLTFVVAEADNIVLELKKSAKGLPVYVNGEKVVDGEPVSVDGFNTIEVPASVKSDAEGRFTFVPTTGKLIKKVALKIGDNRPMFTIYGGVCDEQLGAGLQYYFPTGVDTTDAIKGVCGNYGFALVVENTEYSYIFRAVSVTQMNYAEFVIDTDASPDIENNIFSIRIYEDGRVRVIAEKTVVGLAFEIETQSFARVDIRHTTRAEDPGVEDIEDASSEGLEWLKIESNGEIVGEWTTIPNTLFILDYNHTLTVTSSLSTHNSYYDMDMSKIEGAIFEDTIGLEGGVLTIHTINEETTFFRIELLNPDGTPYVDLYTEIYIAVHKASDPMYDSAEALIANVARDQLATSSGVASVEGLYGDNKIQYVIKISPYRTITDSKTNETVLIYSALEDVPRDGNTTVRFVVKNFEVIKPVFHLGEKLGDIKIKLNSYSQSKSGYTLQEIALYEVLFKQVGASTFETITPTNPYFRGYSFINMKLSDEEEGFLVKFVDAGDGYFAISSTDTAVHRMFSSKLYFAVEEIPEEGDIYLEPIFEPNLIEFGFEYAGEEYAGKAYFDDYKLYLDKPFDPKEEGKYLSGIKYTFKDTTVDWVEIIEVDAPTLVDEGEFEGLYMYELATPWKSHEPDALYEAEVDLRTFEMTIVSVDADGNVTTVKKEILYGIDFVVDDFERIVPPVYPDDGVYNHIGWIEMMDESENYFVTEELEGFIKIKTAATYLWEYDVRLVPVFSANVVSVRFYDSADLILSVNVKSNQEIKVEDFFIDEGTGEFYAPSKFGYKFIGFNRGANLALKLEFDGENNYYLPIMEYNSDIFKFVDPNYLWVASANIDFVACYEEVGYQLILEVEGSTYTDSEGYTAQISGTDSVLYEEVDGTFTLSGFNITDELYMTGFEPSYAHAYIASIRFGYRNGDDITYEESEFFTTCDSNGVLTSTNNGTRFNEGLYTITIQVNELINADTNASAIYVEVVYKPITFRISFTANIMKGPDDIIIDEPSDTIYYKVTHETASIDKVDEWILCDELGVERGLVGWQDIELTESGIVFKENSLEGIAGIFFKEKNVTYSFKAWVDFENNIILDDKTELTKAYNFQSVFSDEFDVTVNYFIFNDSTGYYHKHSYEGYFWRYEHEEYTLGDLLTANSFEIYLIGGKLYYISHWTTNPDYGFISEAKAGDIRVREPYEIEYSPDDIIINYYAVYMEYDFSVDKTGNTYTGVLHVPNDANGNSYSSSDVFFVIVNKALYDNWTGSEFRPVDRLNSRFDSQEKIDEIKIHSLTPGSVTFDMATLGENYLFAVVQRKVDGVVIPSFYLALMITI